MKRKRSVWIAAAILAGSMTSAAQAAYLSGSGTTRNANEVLEDFFEFQQDYEQDPAFEGDVMVPEFCVDSCPADSPGAWSGSAAFGRLSTRASAFSQQPADLVVTSSLSVSFTDRLQVSGPSSGFLLLDYSLHGWLANGGAGHSSHGDLGIQVEGSPVVEVMFQTLDGVPSTTSPEGSFELVGDRWHYTETGTVAIPFGSDPIQLDAAIRAAAICEPACSIETDLGDTLLVGNARLLDPKGLPVEGEIASESGHDYTVPVPEPGGALSTLAGAVALALTRRRAGGKRRRGEARAHGH